MECNNTAIIHLGRGALLMRIPCSSGFILVIAVLVSAFLSLPASAEDKSFYSPVIHIDKENNRVLISTLGSVFYVELPEAAKPHIEKLPISGLVDFVVEMRGDGKPPLVKTW